MGALIPLKAGLSRFSQEAAKSSSRPSGEEAKWPRSEPNRLVLELVVFSSAVMAPDLQLADLGHISSPATSKHAQTYAQTLQGPWN